MKRLLLTAAAWGICSGAISSSSAQGPESAAQPEPSADRQPAAATGAGVSPKTKPGATEKPVSVQLEEIPKDPQGLTGISPFWIAVVQGDAAMLALDYETARNHYQSAIGLLPKKPTGHLRMAELSLKQQQWTQAEEFIGSALRFSEGDMRSKIQATLLLASLRELQHAHEDAIDSYKKYEALDGALPPASDQAGDGSSEGPRPPRIVVETAKQRVAAIEKRLELEKSYAVVAERIRKNVEAADQATGANAGK